MLKGNPDSGGYTIRKLFAVCQDLFCATANIFHKLNCGMEFSDERLAALESMLISCFIFQTTLREEPGSGAAIAACSASFPDRLPLQGSVCVDVVDPGRCPGLDYSSLSGCVLAL